MKRPVLLIAAAALLALAGCGKTDKSGRDESIVSPVSAAASGSEAAGLTVSDIEAVSSSAPDTEEASSATAGNEAAGSEPSGSEKESKTENVNYPVEEVFTDKLFVSIIEGETVPSELICGRGGEGGYNSYSVKDPEKIKEFIEAFRMMTVKEIITDRNEMNNIMDGITDFIFKTEDGSQAPAAFDCCTYANIGDVQYVFENTQKLHELFLEAENKYWDELRSLEK